MKKLLLILLLLIATGCTSSKIGNVKIMTVSDLHYLDSSLYDDGDLFTHLMETGDGKTTEYSDELLEALIERTIEEKPDVLVITGDVTYNGEYISHLSLAEKLKQIEDNGIKVLVLSGNHDVVSQAMKFSGNDYEYVETISGEMFGKIYADYGLNEACAKDPNSNSFIYEVNEGLRLIVLDVNYELKCSVNDKTVNWLRDELKKAENDNVKYLSFTHQNLLKHSAIFDYGYVITRADRVIDLYKKYDVIANFCGHMHIQHIMNDDNFYEVLTESMSLYENHYGIIEVNDKGINYYTKSLDLPGFAKDNNLEDNNLLNFDEFSYNRFMNTNSKKAVSDYEDEDLNKFLATLNLLYFTGRVDEIEIPEEYKNIDSRYLTKIMEEYGNNYNQLKVNWSK